MTESLADFVATTFAGAAVALATGLFAIWAWVMIKDRIQP